MLCTGLLRLAIDPRGGSGGRGGGGAGQYIYTINIGNSKESNLTNASANTSTNTSANSWLAHNFVTVNRCVGQSADGIGFVSIPINMVIIIQLLLSVVVLGISLVFFSDKSTVFYGE